MSETCECGSAVGPFVTDVAGLSLCPPCAAQSSVLCDLCGDEAPVRVYPEGGAADLSIGHPAYLAACRICDRATEEEP